MVIDYQAFGSVGKVPGLNLKPQYNLGRSATHEMGHFFGVLHVWGDGGCSVDDFVADTPNSDKDYLGNCNPSSFFSCGSNDMYQNFLYYTDDACMNIFSAGQVSRMEIILQYAPRRASLLNSVGTEYPQNLGFDLAITSVTAPGKVVCDGEIVPAITIKNNGGYAVKDFDIILSLHDAQYNYTYSGDSIKPGETVGLEFDELFLDMGVYSLTLELINIPDDEEPLNNSISYVFAVDDREDFIPLRQQFKVANFEETNWLTINEDDQIGWEINDIRYTIGSNTAAYINFFNYNARRQIDWLVSPLLDFSGAAEASMKFKTSYAKNSSFNDQLQVVVAEGCESYFSRVLKNYTSNDLSVTNSSAFWEPKSRNDWKEQSIDLGDYAGKREIRIAFLAINDFGNNLYIDDIEFFTTSSDKLVTVAQNSFTLYPNPTFNGQFQLAFNTSERQDVIVRIIDQLGREILVTQFPNTLNQTYYYNLVNQSAGIYYISAQGKDFVRSKKLLIVN